MSLLNTLKKQLSEPPLYGCNQLVVAYSGGVDSHALLHALRYLQQEAEYSFKLHAIHIHHGLSPHADHWQAHCEEVCAELGVTFQAAKVAVKAKPRQSLEALARDARYQKLIELAPADSHLVLAQHQDDQLETFLLQLKRGAGPKGLSSMNQEWSVRCTANPDKKVNFYRPLLQVSQQEIVDYALQQQLSWCEDESNQDTNFERNFLRHEVLPVLLDRWPELAASVARSASLCAQQQAMLDEVCADKLKVAKATENSLLLAELASLDDNWLHQIVRLWLSEQGIANPPFAVLSQLRAEVISAADDATPILQWQDWQFRRFDQQLFVIPVPDRLADFDLVWRGEGAISLPATLGQLSFVQCPAGVDTSSQLIFSPDLGPLTIRLGGYSSKFKPKGSKQSKPIKQWFKQWKIPPWTRARSLIILQNDLVLAVYIDGRWYLANTPYPTENTFLIELKSK